MGCDACFAIGISKLDCNGSQKSPKPKKGRILYNLGNNEFTNDRDEASKRLLQKHFPSVHLMHDIIESDYKCGMVGVRRIPALNLSEIPKVAEPKKYRHVAKSKGGAIIGIER